MANWISRARTRYLNRSVNDGQPDELFAESDAPRHAQYIVRNVGANVALVGTQDEDDTAKFFLLEPGKELCFESRDRVPIYGYKTPLGGDAVVSILIAALPGGSGYEVTPLEEAD